MVAVAIMLTLMQGDEVGETTLWPAHESLDARPRNQTELSNSAGVKLLNSVGSTSLFSPLIS